MALREGRMNGGLEPGPQEVLKGHLVDLSGGGQGIVVGTRIPREYFRTKGCGQTDSGGGNDPWETGSYDLALEDAKIEDFNVVAWTSVISPEAVEVDLEEAAKTFHHGAVLEVIMAKMHGMQGDRISAGVGQAMVRRKRDGMLLGGYAAEYSGHAREPDVRKILKNDLKEIFERRYSNDKFELIDEKYTIQLMEVEKGYGTVLACLGFTSFIYPLKPGKGEMDPTSPAGKFMEPEEAEANGQEEDAAGAASDKKKKKKKHAQADGHDEPASPTKKAKKSKKSKGGE